MLLKNEVALITGAGSGIGKATALLFSKEGAKVGLLDLDERDLAATAQEIEKAGGRAIVLQADISDAAQMEKAVKKTVDTFGKLDVVFANAGINGVWAPLEELKPDEWDMTMDVNLKGTFLTVKFAIPYLKEKGGSVIITSSVNGTRIFSNTGATAYSCSKAAQVAFTKMAALELAKYRIRVNVICPGAIETSIGENTAVRGVEKEKEPVEFPEGKIPLTDGRSGSSDQIAQLVLFLASDQSNHITGTPVWIDGGESLLMG